MVDLFEEQGVIASRNVIDKQTAILDAGRFGEVGVVVVFAKLEQGVDLVGFAAIGVAGQIDADGFTDGSMEDAG